MTTMLELPPQEVSLTVAFLTPWLAADSSSSSREPCGVADYSDSLVAELQKLVDLRIIPLESRWHPTGLGYLRHWKSDTRYYRSLGLKLNAGQVAHLQFQYPFFGGMAPHKNKLPAVLSTARVPIVMTVHEIDDVGTGLTASVKDYINGSLFRRKEVRHLIVHSHQYREKLLRLGVDSASIHVVPIPVPRPVALGQSVEDLRQRYGLTGRQIVTMIGFVVPRKGYDLALAMLERLSPEVVLVFAGGPSQFSGRDDYFQQLQSRIGSSPLKDRVRITGTLDKTALHEWIVASDLILAPFTQMSSSASINLALSYHKPVVASDLPGFVEMNACHPCLELFETGKVEELARKAVRVLDDAEARAALQQGAREYAAQCSAQRIAEETEAIYRSLTLDEQSSRLPE